VHFGEILFKNVLITSDFKFFKFLVIFRLEMARAASGPVFGRAAHDIFNRWISPSRRLMLKKNFKIYLSRKNHSVAIKVG